MKSIPDLLLAVACSLIISALVLVVYEQRGPSPVKPAEVEPWCLGPLITLKDDTVVYDFDAFRGLVASAPVDVLASVSPTGPWTDLGYTGKYGSMTVPADEYFLRFRTSSCGITVEPVGRRVVGCQYP